MLKQWFSKNEGENQKTEDKATSRLRLFSHANFDREKLIGRLEPDLQFFARSFYDKFSDMLPQAFSFVPDKNAPEDSQPLLHNQPNHFSKLSLEYHFREGIRTAKYGTGRVEKRNHFYFAKTVTWLTPKNFLHQRKVYEIIKLYYPESRIMPTKSKTQNGFALKSNKHVITLEVFGDNSSLGFLACDISLNSKNQPLARDRMLYFMEFYGALYNLLERGELIYSVKPKLPQDMDVEFIEDYQSHLEDCQNKPPRPNYLKEGGS